MRQNLPPGNPANVLITKAGEVKIVDFGLAKLAGQKLTKDGATPGTVAYLCFDRARGLEATPQSDIWSFGVVLYEMLTGQLPFKGEHDQVVLLAILNEEPEPVANYRADMPAELQHIIDRCLSKEPKDCYQTAAGSF